jgi:hypothetical protein
MSSATRWRATSTVPHRGLIHVHDTLGLPNSQLGRMSSSAMASSHELLARDPQQIALLRPDCVGEAQPTADSTIEPWAFCDMGGERFEP